MNTKIAYRPAFKPLLWFIIVCLTASLGRAGVSGKLTGRVSDANTGEGLVGTNIILAGTTIGAASDINGNFIILNVPPGSYDVTASMVGYTATTMQQVRVEIDLTTRIDFSLRPEVLKGEMITVKAERKLVKVDVAASQRSISADQIDALPVGSISDVIGLQAGVSGFSIRGGGESQTMYMVDGVVLNDARTSSPRTAIPLSAVQDLSIQTGGFNAEYHNVRSGIVNIVSKEGHPDHYSGTVQIRYSPPANKYFGISPYDPNSYWFRPYTDPEVMWTGTGNGAWDEYTRAHYPRFDGWNAIARQSLEDSDPGNDLTPSGAYKLFTWEHRKRGDIVRPDYNIDAGFGGPIPVMHGLLGNLRFFASVLSEQDQYLYRVASPGLNRTVTMLKLTSDLSRTMKLSFTGRYEDLDATTLSRGGLTDYFDSSWDLANQVDRAGFTVPWRLYTNYYWCPTTIQTSSYSAKLTHQLSQNTFYQIIAQYDIKDYYTDHGPYRKYRDVGTDGLGPDDAGYPGPDEDGTEGNGEYDTGEPTVNNNEVFPGWLADEAPFGFWGVTSYSNEGRLSFGGAISTSRDDSRTRNFSLKFDLTSQITPRNEIQGGAELVYTDLDLRFGSENFFLPLGNYTSTVRQYPYRFFSYLQDKLEFQGFVAVVGLNMDYVNPNGKWYSLDFGSGFFKDLDYDFFSSSYNEEVESEYPTEMVAPHITFSPRLAISHPITEVSKLYFNYGHYRQMPIAESLYRVHRHPDGNLYTLGDPTLPLARTISYELGYDHGLFESYLLHLSAYYKDVTDQQDYTDYISTNGKVNYSQLTANSYEDIRGFEIDLSKVRGDWLTGLVNYEYRVSTSGYFGVGEYYDSPKLQREYILKNPQQYKPIPSPRLKSVLDLRVPTAVQPHFLADWHLNLISRWTAGGWFTYNPNNIKGISYNVQWKDNYSFDVKLSKTFRVHKARVKFFVDVNNMFNLKRFSGYGFIDSYDWDDYMQSLHLPEEVVSKLAYNYIPGDDQPGDYRAAGTKFVPLKWIAGIFTGAAQENYLDPATLHQGALEDDREIYYYDASTGKYMQYSGGLWSEAPGGRIDEILDSKAYIDMPNQSSFVFLAPRDIFMGLTIYYDF